MEPDPTQDTIPSPAVRLASQSPLARFVRSMPGAFLILAVGLGSVLTLAALAGYYAGSSDRDRVAATAQSVELAVEPLAPGCRQNGFSRLLAGQDLEQVARGLKL